MDIVLVLTFMYDCYYNEAYIYPEEYSNRNKERDKYKISQRNSDP